MESREYYQAEILNDKGNLTGMTVNEKGCLTCVGDGLKFSTKAEAEEWISKSKAPNLFKVTEHIDSMRLDLDI